MAKEKVQSPSAPAPAALTGERQFKYNKDVDDRLNTFIEKNPETIGSMRELVKQYPERAARSLALHEMFRQEKMARQIERQMPQVQAWVSERPGLKEELEAKIRTTNPLKRMKAFITEAIWTKGRIEFAPPKVTPNVGVSVSA